MRDITEIKFYKSHPFPSALYSCVPVSQTWVKIFTKRKIDSVQPTQINLNLAKFLGFFQKKWRSLVRSFQKKTYTPMIQSPLENSTALNQKLELELFG